MQRFSSHVCPWWLIRTFDNPVRRLFQNPEQLLRDIIRSGDTCVDIGCGIGYFTISMARLVGPAGSVTAVDLQPEMLAGVERRAEKVGVRERIRLHQADASSLSLGDLRPRSVQPGDLQPADLRSGGGFDFALTFWMVHEVSDQPGLFRQIREVLRPGGHLLLVEPMVHVPRRAYITTVATAEQAGFVRERAVRVAFSRGGLFTTGGARY